MFYSAEESPVGTNDVQQITRDAGDAVKAPHQHDAALSKQQLASELLQYDDGTINLPDIAWETVGSSFSGRHDSPAAALQSSFKAIDEPSGAADEVQQANAQSSPAIEETARAADEVQQANAQSSPAIEDTAGATDEVQQANAQSSTAIEETARAADEVQQAIAQSSTAIEETARAAGAAQQGNAQSSSAIEETTGAAEAAQQPNAQSSPGMEETSGAAEAAQQPNTQSASGASSAWTPLVLYSNPGSNAHGQQAPQATPNSYQSGSTVSPRGAELLIWSSRSKGPVTLPLGTVLACIILVACIPVVPLLAVGFPVAVLVILAGLYMKYLYHRAVEDKETTRQLMKVSLGSKGLKSVLGEVPSWVPYMEDRERLEWLNKILHDVWSTLDQPISLMVRQTVEPLMDIYKPSFISKLGFKKLSLGDAPIRLEELRVTKETSDAVELEVDFRWKGQPSITFFVELLFIGRYTRMAPRLSDLSVSGTAKIILKPMLPSLVPPGFGAMLFSLTKPPLLKFNLNFGVALGGNLTARPVAAFLDPFIRETLANLLVWPQRIVIPLLPEEVTGPLNELQLRSVGVLYVEVVYCRGLPKKGFFRRMDPQVELFTEPQRKYSTNIKIKTVHPVWNQQFRLLVQEPQSQCLRVTLYDVETMRAETLLTLNIVKGIKDMVFSREVEGRAEIPLAGICSKPGELTEQFYTFCAGDWGNLDDMEPKGEIQLKLKYLPFTQNMSARVHYQGVLFVDVIKIQDAGVPDEELTAYVIVKVAGETRRTATLLPGQHAFNTHFEFLEVSHDDAVTIKVWDNRVRRLDRFLGKVVISVRKLLRCNDENQHGTLHRLLRLERGVGGNIEVALHFKPYEEQS